MGETYFSVLAFGWAGLGVGSRVAMFMMKDRWKSWEMNSAYAEQRPAWVWVAGLAGLLLIALTWYMVITTDVRFSWILAVLVSLTGVKVSVLLFDYERFRRFASETLADRSKMIQLNGFVLTLSVVRIWMGVSWY